MSKEDMIAVLWALENDLRLRAAQQWRTAAAFLSNGDAERASKAQGVYEGLQAAIQALQEKRRGLGGTDDDRGHRKSASEGDPDPKAPARD